MAYIFKSIVSCTIRFPVVSVRGLNASNNLLADIKNTQIPQHLTRDHFRTKYFYKNFIKIVLILSYRMVTFLCLSRTFVKHNVIVNVLMKTCSQEAGREKGRSPCRRSRFQITHTMGNFASIVGCRAAAGSASRIMAEKLALCRFLKGGQRETWPWSMDQNTVPSIEAWSSSPS